MILRLLAVFCCRVQTIKGTNFTLTWTCIEHVLRLKMRPGRVTKKAIKKKLWDLASHVCVQTTHEGLYRHESCYVSTYSTLPSFVNIGSRVLAPCTRGLKLDQARHRTQSFIGAGPLLELEDSTHSSCPNFRTVVMLLQFLRDGERTTPNFGRT